MKPNVLLVVLDAARRDAFEPYGAEAGSTPTIAQLAARGRALPEVYATGCWTVPSHASFFTGLMPRHAGLSRVQSPGAARPAIESLREQFLPEVLRGAGYSTLAVSANLWLSRSSGFDLGFEEFISVDTGRHGQLGRASLRQRARWIAEAVRGRVDDGLRAAEDRINDWIVQPRSRPFFCFANVIECHSPYLPPRPYGEGSTLDRVRAAGDARRYYHLEAIWRACVGGYEVPDSTIERMRRFYRGSIRYMDDWLGRLLERLDGTGRLDETLVVVISDHGENFGEGGLLAHGLSLDNRLIHVPLVVAGPGSGAFSITSLAELPRALAGAIGLTDHPWIDELPRAVGVAQFDPPADDPDDPRVVETVERWGLGEEAVEKLTTPMACAVSGRLKVIRRGEREQVFDLDRDPLELAPVSPDELSQEAAAPLSELRRALDHPAMTAGAPELRQQQRPSQASEEELADIEERMKLLGYM